MEEHLDSGNVSGRFLITSASFHLPLTFEWVLLLFGVYHIKVSTLQGDSTNSDIES